MMEEMNSLKDDMQFILENKTKSKMKEKLEKSKQYIDLNSSALNDSSVLDNSVISNVSTNTIKKKYNIKEKFAFDQNLMCKFNEFLMNYNVAKNLLLLVDNRNTIWELVRRNDLNIGSLNSNCENLISVTAGISSNKYFLDDDSPKSRLLNIEIKDNYDNRSMNNSELDISKVTDFNISHYIRETNNDVSEIS